MDAQSQWEYKQVRVDLAHSSEALLRELGAEGWELVSVDGGQAYLKRRLPPPRPISSIKVTGRMG